ncbi:MAG: imidazole glycerol phosphate synthase subunit HisF [Zetaproteobacteria bacterium]|nr:imidazole glycerol phosphate synthase subunit HisF [Pseudobdellovibrionaceae bacterium]
MLARRIIPCLDVRDGVVVKGVKFKDHVVLGGILELAKKYRDAGADELVFYDITASVENRTVSREWITETAKELDIPFAVAGGIKSIEDARAVFHAGADKISINSPALNRPELINELAATFGSQAVVIGIDSMDTPEGYITWKYTGSEKSAQATGLKTLDWVREVQDRGAGEIVLNCMNQDGMRSGYAIEQLQKVRAITSVPLIASGGAGCREDFKQVFKEAQVDGALAAGVFHRGEIEIPELKSWLRQEGVSIRE